MKEKMGPHAFARVRGVGLTWTVGEREIKVGRQTRRLCEGVVNFRLASASDRRWAGSASRKASSPPGPPAGFGGSRERVRSRGGRMAAAMCMSAGCSLAGSAPRTPSSRNLLVVTLAQDPAAHLGDLAKAFGLSPGAASAAPAQVRSGRLPRVGRTCSRRTPSVLADRGGFLTGDAALGLDLSELHARDPVREWWSIEPRVLQGRTGGLD
jgi:hypothetical protein